ncbi:MAG: DUF3659 domain-containing protein [Fibromonadales bacterium]|nr:DUF3659 domain-containing protein [Fibromonadales bacterium]
MIANSDYGTKMDDVILESLKPQVEEIKKRIAGGGGLSHEDIITLTLYTQGNHINHIDMRMDAMDERMDALCIDFSTLRADINSKIADLEGKIVGMEGKIVGLEGKIVGLEGKMIGIEGKIVGIEGKIDSKISGLEVKLEQFRGDSSKMTAVISSICAASIAIATIVTNIISR